MIGRMNAAFLLISVILCSEYAVSDLLTEDEEEEEDGGLESFRSDRPRIEARAFDTLGGGMIPLVDRRRASLLLLEGLTRPVEKKKKKTKKEINVRRKMETRGFDTLGGGEIPWIDRRRRRRFP